MDLAHRTTRSRRPLALLAALLLFFVALLATASPAHAHDELLGSDPAADSTVDALPAELTLSFSAAIAPDEGASEVQVTDAAGTQLTDGTPTAQDNVLTQPLSGTASGPITVLWKVVSSDGHPISGEFSFTVAGAPTPTDTASPSPTATETASPTPSETASPTTTPVPAPASADMTPWIIAGVVVLLLVIAAIVYLLVSRSRREKALSENRDAALRGDSGPESGRSGEH
jgi:methionine-rich copper-binding protein CopC